MKVVTVVHPGHTALCRLRWCWQSRGLGKSLKRPATAVEQQSMREGVDQDDLSAAGERGGAALTQNIESSAHLPAEKKPHPLKGRKLPPDVIAKRRATCAARGPITFSAETREKMRQARLGKRLSIVTRMKMSESGRGRTFSDETRQKMRLSQRERRRQEKLRMSDDEGAQSSASEVPTCDPADAPKKRRPRRTDWNKQASKGTAVSAVSEE